VSSGASAVGKLSEWLILGGVDRVTAVDHEDDLPEVSLLVDWAWQRLGKPARGMLGVLSYMSGDHMDTQSLFELSRTSTRATSALGQLRRWHLVQEPFSGRFALHAVVRHAIRKKVTFDSRRTFAHYLAMLEQSPERFDLEQTHLFAAMDFAHSSSNLALALRIDRLLTATQLG
jgi:hypothetical protein